MGWCRVARRSPNAQTASVTWRDGVHLTGTPLWCDARRRRDVCFVSSADRVGKTGHGQLIASPLTLALLGAQGGGHLGVPLHRRFTLGTVRLELVASGRGPGAAALFVDIAGRTVLYAGAVRPTTAHLEGSEVRACDAVVVAAPYGKPEHRFAPLASSIDETLAWAHAELAADRRPVILVDTALDGLEVAMVCATAGLALAGGRPIREAVQRAGALATEAMVQASARAARDAELRGVTAAPPAEAPALQIASPGKEPRAVIWLARDRGGLAKALGEQPHAIRDSWRNAADRAELLSWIEATSAREVFVTGTCAEAIASALGPRAKIVGPPTQMTLFEALP
jgi:putative mRNA 3-end processing factor